MATNTSMAVTDTYDSLLSTTLKYWAPGIKDEIFRGNPLLWMLENKGRKKVIDGGESIMGAVMYGGNETIGFYGKYDTLNVTPQEGLGAYRTKWAQVAGSVSISGLEMFQNSGPHKIVDLLETKVKQLQMSLRWGFNDHLHGVHGRALSGSSGKTHCGGDSNTKDSLGGTSVDHVTASGYPNINSLDHFVRMKAGYGASTAFNVVCEGITTSVDTDDTTTAVNPWWMNYSIPGYTRMTRDGNMGAATSAVENTWADAVDTIGATDNYLENVMTAMYHRLGNDGEFPNMILGSQELYDLYERANRQRVRYQSTNVADAGFETCKFKGADFVLDHGITTALAAGGTDVPLYFLNLDYFDWVVGKGKDFEPTQFYRPLDQDAKTAQILFYGQLVCTNRAKQGVISCDLA